MGSVRLDLASMSSLRNFRFQKTKPSTPSRPDSILTDSPSSASEPPSQPSGSQNGNGAAKNGNTSIDSDIVGPTSKKPRLLSDDESSPASSPVEPASNGYGFGGMPSPDVVQSRLDL